MGVSNFLIPEGSTKITRSQNSPHGVRAEFPPNERWSFRAFGGWWQDINEWTNEETGEVFPPTFAWYARFSGMRAKPSPKAEYYYVQIMVQGKEGEPINAMEAKLAMERGAAEFDSYADCACVVGNNCVRHGGSPDGNNSE